jgi:hypothetical protein
MPARPSKETEAGARRPLPAFTEKHERLRAEIRRFVAEELRPHAREWEDARWFPNDVFIRMAELGLLGLKYPRELGGRGGDHLDDAVLTEELSRCGSGGVAAGIGAHVGIATPPIWSFGTEDQKQRFLAPAIRGEKIAALGITEPGAGSDAAGLRTSARRVGGGYLVLGEENSGFYLAVAGCGERQTVARPAPRRTTPIPPRHRPPSIPLSLFVQSSGRAGAGPAEGGDCITASGRWSAGFVRLRQFGSGRDSRGSRAPRLTLQALRRRVRVLGSAPPLRG